MAHLIVRIDGEESRIELASGEIISIGRDATNTIALVDERKASRRHCQITPVRRDGHEVWEVTDLGATNKTRVNKKETDRKLLSHGDVVQIGKVEVEYNDEAELERLRNAGQKGVCYLEWMSGDRRGEKVWLEGARTTLGRRESNTIPLDDKMSSSHHAEITKDLNGYTVRDLGSTNGTLVNGEPTSETMLAHGMRIRVGNSRLMFKDPAMKDIEIELSQVEEDDGWGMMGDIDLSKAKGSYAGLLVSLVILGLAGAGGWYITQQAADKRAGTGVVDLANEFDNGGMEDADALAFEAVEDRDDVDVRINDKGRSGKGLSLRHSGEEGSGTARILHADQFDALPNEPFRLEADFRGGEGATLIAQWVSSGGTLTRSIPIAVGEGGWTSVDRLLPRPKWARALRVAVDLNPSSNAMLDNVRLTKVETPASERLDVPGDTVVQDAVLAGAGGLDMTGSGDRPMVVGLSPIARVGGKVLRVFVPDEAPQGGKLTGAFLGADEPVPASIAWSKTDQGIEAVVTCADAQAVGLQGFIPRTIVGDHLSVLSSTGARSLPTRSGRTAEGIVKSLAGSTAAGGRLVLFVVPGEGGATVEMLPSSDSDLVAVAHWLTGSEGRVSLVTDYAAQRADAQQALADGRDQLRTDPAAGIQTLRSVAVAYPFDDAVRDAARRLSTARETKALADIDALGEAIEAFAIYGSPESLKDVQTRTAALTSAFPPATEDTTGLRAQVAELAARASELERTWYAENAGAELGRLERVVGMLSRTTGYEPMAALYLRSIVGRWGHMAEDDSAFGRRVAKAQEDLDKLLKSNPELRKAVPPPAAD